MRKKKSYEQRTKRTYRPDVLTVGVVAVLSHHLTEVHQTISRREILIAIVLLALC
jgi:hypothetical protein